MATGQTMQKQRSRAAFKMYDHDPAGGATTVLAVAWVDMKDFGEFMATIFRTVGTSATTFDIGASASADGSSAVAVVAHAVGDEPNAVGDQLHLEISAEQLAGMSTAGLRYVSARISCATGTDEFVVSYRRAKPRFAKDGLTADIVA